jgi:hypothetical protein
MALEFRFLNSVDLTGFATHIYFGGSSCSSPDTLSLHEIMAVPIHDPLVGPILINQHGRVRLTPSMIPDASNFDAKDSSFFNKWSELPSPNQVREKAEAQWLSGTSLDKRRSLLYGGAHVRPPPAVFEDMGLVVKWGIQVGISEAQSIYAIHRFLNGRIPVPEVYGWRTDRDEKFIYMQYMRGRTLEEAWESLEHNERDIVCHQLRTAFNNLRQLKQDPSDTFIGLYRPNTSLSNCSFLDYSIIHLTPS